MNDSQSPLSIMMRYRYAELPSDGKPFRLLKLHNAAGEGGLRIDLIHHELSSAPAYTAVSYAWGSEERAYTIALGETEEYAALPVTAAVHEMLNSLKPDPGDANPLYLWVDFVCINQDDPFEKDRQIPLMREIYAGAAETVCYLGQVPDAALAHEFVPLLNIFWAYIISLQRLDIYVTSDNLLFNPFVQHPESKAAFRRLLSNRYWTRSWIIQEIISAKKVRLRYGDQYIEWDILSALIEFFWAHVNGNELLLQSIADEPSGNAVWAMNCVDNLRTIKRFLASNGPLPLQDVLLLACQSNATEARDKVIAVLGLSQEATTPHLQPNHALTTAQVYTTVVWHTLQQGSFALLNLAGKIHHTTMKSPLSLPSWVPDLSHPPLLWPLDTPQTKYTAGGPAHPATTDTTTPIVRLSLDETTLSARGFCVGRILAIAPSFDRAFHLTSRAGYPALLNFTRNLDSALAAPGAWLRNAWGLARRVMPEGMYPAARGDVPVVSLEQGERLVVPVVVVEGGVEQETESGTEETLRDAFWRTLVGDEDTDADGVVFPAPEQVGRDFGVYWDICMRGLVMTQAEQLPVVPTDDEMRANAKVSSLVGKRAWPRRFALTDRGYMTLVLDGVEVGDEVVVFWGAKTPYVVRPVEGEQLGRDGGKQYELLGEAYLHGFMKGEGVNGGFEEMWFDLV